MMTFQFQNGQKFIPRSIGVFDEELLDVTDDVICVSSHYGFFSYFLIVLKDSLKEIPLGSMC